VVARTKAEQREATRAALVQHARDAFAADGYADTNLVDVCRAAGVTKGALYHHFDGKSAILRAVLEQIHEEVADLVAASAPDADPWTRLLAGCETFLVASTAPRVQRIMLVDAPSVLGWDTWDELDARTSRRHLEDALTALVAAGAIADQPIEPLTHLLSGAMNAAALWLARSEDRDRDLAATMTALTRLVGSLRATAPA
jgi:AcrR family transcriptional regulator